MENVSSIHSIPAHAYAADALFRARTTLTDSIPTVVVTSVLTQTIRPTLVSTESTVITPDPVTVQTTATQGTMTVQTAEPDTHQITHIETASSNTMLQQTLQDTSSATSTSTTVSSSLMQEHWVNANTSVPDPASTSLASTSPSSLGVSTSTSSSILSIITSNTPTWEISTSGPQHTSSQLTSIPISLSHSASSPTTSPVTVIPGSASTQDSTEQTTHNPTNVGAIVGATIGGAAFIALGVLACCFFIRRKGNIALHQRHISRNGLLGHHPSSPIRSLEISEPTLPMMQLPVIPSAPVFPARRYSNSDSQAVHESTDSTRDVSPKATSSHIEDQHHQENPFADPGDSPLLPTVQISSPTHTASVYSQGSLESGLELNGSTRHNSYESTHNPGLPNLTLPGNINASNPFILTRDTKNRTSTRSDPFDLELPPDVLKWPLP